MKTEARSVQAPAQELLDGFEMQAFMPYLLNQAKSWLDVNLRIALKPFDLSIHQWRVLLMLRLSGSCSIGDISNRTVMGQSTITRVADQLEKAGLAQRSPFPGNNRVILLSLTGEGEKLIEQLVPAVFSVHEGCVDGMDPAEQKLLFKMLRTLVENLRRHEARQRMMNSNIYTFEERRTAGN